MPDNRVGLKVDRMNGNQSQAIPEQYFSFWNLFYLPGGDDNLELRARFRQIGGFYWACLILPAYYIAEQVFIFHITRFLPILLPTYGLLVIAPLVYRFFSSIQLYAAYTITCGMALVFILLGCEGGNLSPGISWIFGAPMAFGLFYGKRGVVIGSVIVVLAFATFILLNHWHLLPNIVEEIDNYRQQEVINLLTYGIYNAGISYHFLNVEEKAKRELRLQRQESENLLRILVHDVANPINAIQLMTHAVKTGQRDPEQILMLVDGALGELSAIVQQVRKLHALKDGKLALELSLAEIQSLLNESIDLLRQQADHKQISFDLTIANEPAWVQVDEALLKNVVFANLISNAIKFSHPGQRISIELVTAQDSVTVSVADHGIGMSANLMRQIFDPAAATTRRGTRGEQGTGYGMPLVKTLLSKMGGEIAVQSSQVEGASGTRVSISLPRFHQ